MNRNLFSIIIVIVTALLGPGCDPQNEPGTQGAASPAKKDDTAAAKHDVATPAKDADAASKAGAAGAAANPAPGQFASLSSCQQSCEDPKLLPTDRATCRLNCDNAYGTPATAATPGDRRDPISDAVACLDRCHATNPAALDSCTAGCNSIAAAAPGAPAAAVLDRLATCIGTCRANKRALPTNRVTCDLNCTQEARVAGPAQPAAPR